MVTNLQLSRVSRALAKPLKGLSETRPLKYLAQKYQEDPVKFVSYTSLATVVVKDVIGGVFYVRQSMKNEKIPKEKRGFVAALDFTNSVLMISTQIAAFFTVQNEKCIDWTFKKTVGRYFNKANRRSCKEEMRALNKDLSRVDFTKAFKDAEKTAKDGFKVFLPLVAASIFAKRVVVPFLSTPAATWAKNKFFNNVGGEQDQNGGDSLIVAGPNTKKNTPTHKKEVELASLPDVYKKHFA